MEIKEGDKFRLTDRFVEANKYWQDKCRIFVISSVRVHGNQVSGKGYYEDAPGETVPWDLTSMSMTSVWEKLSHEEPPEEPEAELPHYGFRK